MHKNVMNAAINLAFLVRMLDDDSLDIFMKHMNFMSEKFAAGEIKNEDEYMAAIDAFFETLIDDKE